MAYHAARRRRDMKIVIANQDRTAELEPALRAEADLLLAHPDHVQLPAVLHALSLREARGEVDFLERWTAMVRRKCHVDTLKFEIPRRPGLVGGLLQRMRVVLWKALRYQHNRVVSRQNLVNSHLVATLEFQADEISRLRERLDVLERKDGGA